MADGSSPRLRGTAAVGPTGPPGRRFIPAPTGNSPGRGEHRGSTSVHPRACGDQGAPARDPRSPMGSSPRLRGTGASKVWEEQTRTFIPAPAGNSSAVSRSTPWPSVHPRACGEQWRSRPRSIIADGSSPRLRGTAARPQQRPDVQRFIPAPAGNRRAPRGDRRPLPVHPRACGEQCHHRTRHRLGVGSSPRLRGTGAVGHNVQVGGRFIPAPAGNRPGQWPQPGHQSVHPRACGEQLDAMSHSRLSEVHPRACGEQLPS